MVSARNGIRLINRAAREGVKLTYRDADGSAWIVMKKNSRYKLAGYPGAIIHENTPKEAEQVFYSHVTRRSDNEYGPLREQHVEEEAQIAEERARDNLARYKRLTAERRLVKQEERELKARLSAIEAQLTEVMREMAHDLEDRLGDEVVGDGPEYNWERGTDAIHFMTREQ